MCRYASRAFVCACLLFFASSFASAQITNVTNDQSTPIPGAGHDYIHMLTETVNPANGSVSVRIQVPVPKGRGLTLPFAFAYDSNGVHHPGSAGNGVMAWYSNTSFLSAGGWAYSMPLASMVPRTMTYNQPPHYYTCNYYVDYMFQDPSGGRHALRLSAWDYGSVSQCQQIPGAPHNYLSGGDDFYQAITPDPTSGLYGGPWLPVLVSDEDGTVYHFPGTRGFELVPKSGEYASLPDYVEDRNGNKITITDNSNGAFTILDTAGRTALSSSGFGTSGNTVSVSGLTSPYTLTWGTASSSYSVGPQKIGTDSYCNNFLNESGSVPVVTKIALPNGQAYYFYYDSTYGLLDEIIFPTGGWVKYTWGLNPQSEFGSFADTMGNAEACDYTYGSPAVAERQVSFDGTNVAEEQDFSYSTTWNGVSWTSKTTTMTTRDHNRGGSFQTVYNYSSVGVPLPPNEVSLFSGQAPVENTITYYDWNGSKLRTVSKGWQDQYLMTRQVTQLENGQTSEKDYSYSNFCGALCTLWQLTDEKDYDYGSGSHGALLKETQISYASFAASPIFTNGASNYRTIFDRPSSVITKDGSGNRVAETDYGYDQTAVSGLSGITGHDDSNYGASYNNRGNATTKTEWLNTGGASPVTTYTYDETGQMRTMKDPKQNVTSYSYADNYTSGSPPGATNAYLTQITYPNTGFAHVVKFAYNYADGQLASSTDQNNQTTSYFYSDSLNRLTGINYPDCVAQGTCNSTTHSIAYVYNDAPPSPTVTTEKLLSPGQYETSESIMDGAGHVTRTELTSDPSGTDYTDASYDGEGRVWKQSNPYRSTGDPSYGLTTTAYDALGRVTSITHPDSNIASTSYAGNCTTSTDEQSKARKSCMDGLGRLKQVFEDPSGLNYETDYQYDTLDNLTHVTEGSQTRIFVYDSLSRELSAANPESGTVTYTYDANGNVHTKQDARGITTTYAHDSLNRLTAKSYSDGTPVANFWYDYGWATFGGWNQSGLTNTIGRLMATCTDPSIDTCSSTGAGTVYSYDPMGRVMNYWQCTPYNCNSSAWQQAYNYDLAGDVKSWTHPAGFTITNSINNAQQITQIQSSLVDLTHPQYLAQNITYTPWGAEQALENGCAGSGCTNTLETYAYNNRMQPVRIELGTPSNPTADSCLVYNYYTSVGNPNSCATPAQGAGNNGSVMSIFDQDNVNTSLSHTEAYTYDSLNRLTNAVATGNSTYNLTFAYDHYGNMTCQTNAQTQGVCPNYSFDPSTNHINTLGFTYDVAGNLTADGSHTYQYDAEGHMISVDNGSTATFGYNALGWRVNWGSGLSYWHDATGGELGGNWGSGANSFIYWNGRELADYEDRLYFAHATAQNTMTQDTNWAGTASYEVLFYPWGTVWQNPSGQIGGYLHQVFAGLQDYDPSLDQYQPEFRRYAPTLSRWLTPDPGSAGADPANPQSWNAYTYAGNNPTTLADPSGLNPGDSCTVNPDGTVTCPSTTVNVTADDPGPMGFIPVHVFGPITVRHNSMPGLLPFFTSSGLVPLQPGLQISTPRLITDVNRCAAQKADSVSAASLLGVQGNTVLNALLGSSTASASRLIFGTKLSEYAPEGLNLAAGAKAGAVLNATVQTAGRFEVGQGFQSVFTTVAPTSFGQTAAGQALERFGTLAGSALDTVGKGLFVYDAAAYIGSLVACTQ